MAKERSEQEQNRDSGAEHHEALSDQHLEPQEHEPEVEIEEPSAEEQHEAEDALHEEAHSAEALKAQIVSLQEQIDIQRDTVLRSQAEAQNARRRAEQDIDRARKYATEKLLQDLLPVVDNMERALASIDQGDEANKAVIEGIELTRKSFLDTLAKNGVEEVDPTGEPFDPELHQAMTQVPNGDVEPNTVLEVFQKGYRLHGRLVRPAMVVVSKALS
ncbi:nucleotide exchange factor GrpE [Microbulbifer flavimaris]|uniref:Protein GrpE n=1 Tax=Microbulbifer flavimaris TaxID=1781068 RepID=A0ABX4HY90_9GAMM|nr:MULTISPECIES: nucleotide exchange factor GrpE [Microbulbifer]KUJ82553.1 molecular chaperone GrpE [Microbulbifer sp. ZGT114]PCO04763.1 nucleotide exchange factor GrpE [Microbulbifer flavimaris]